MYHNAFLSLQPSITDNKNAFDLLRLLLACGVIIAHSYLLGGYTGSDFLTVLSKGQTNLADVSVMGFFVLSGYLITASFQRTDHLVSFMLHRILRVYPGYWVCLLVTGFGFASLIALLSNGNTGSFTLTGPASSFSYFYHNFFIKINQWSVGNVLNKTAYNDSLNGSLWSLYPEIQCYIFTLILGYFGLFNRNKAVVLLLFVFTLVIFVAKDTFHTNIGPTFLYLSNALKLYVAYLGGMMFFVFKDKIIPNKKLLIFTGACTALLIKFGGFQLVSPIILSYLLICGFQLFKVRLRHDISYGIYIYGFPIQQMLFVYFGNRLPLFVFVFVSLLLAALLGLLSHLLVERPFIKLKKPADRYIYQYYKKKKQPGTPV